MPRRSPFKIPRIPEMTVRRLSVYPSCLLQLEEDGIKTISSQELAERFSLNSAQVRKDLAYFGEFGVRGIGYYVSGLKAELQRILGLDREWQVALVGFGNLGSALFHYKGFARQGFRISAIFDDDPGKAGKLADGVPILPMRDLARETKGRNLQIAILAALAQGVAFPEARGLWGPLRALVARASVRDTGRPVLYLSPGTAERPRAAEDTRFFRDTLDSARTPVLDFPPAEPSSWHGRHRDHVAERALVCHALVTGGAIVVVTTPAALGASIFSPETFRARTFTLTVGASLEREGLLRALETAGYERVDTVVEVGQWSLRGGIVDIFSATHDRPARAEFFGDEIESLRLFDPTTQRSVETLSELTVLPLAGAEADHT